MTPGEDLICDLRAYEVLGDEKSEHLMSEETGEGGIIEYRQRAEVTIACGSVEKAWGSESDDPIPGCAALSRPVFAGATR
jgi:hypothetical protein